MPAKDAPVTPPDGPVVPPVVTDEAKDAPVTPPDDTRDALDVKLEHFEAEWEDKLRAFGASMKSKYEAERAELIATHERESQLDVEAAEAASDGLVKMVKGDAVSFVHETCVAPHKVAGWKVAS